MKYFILYVTFKDNSIKEFYLKGKSRDFVEAQIGRYLEGSIYTAKYSIYTEDAMSSYIREINIKDFPHLSKSDFQLINKNKSYNVSNLV